MITQKQKDLAKELLENRGVPLGQAMRKAGYSDAQSRNPKQIVETKGFQELMELIGLTDDKLLEVLQQGLGANKVISARVTNKDADVDTDDFIEVPDHPTRHKFLETGLRLKGYANKDSSVNIQFNQMNVGDQAIEKAANYADYLRERTRSTDA